MNNEELKELIETILNDNYINQETRFTMDSKTQGKVVAMNTGLTRAISSIIHYATNKEELTKFAQDKIHELNCEGVQEVE